MTATSTRNPEVFNADAYGRMARDGVTDDSPIIQAAITAAEAAGHAVVQLPPGRIALASKLTVSGSNIKLRGHGKGVTTLVQKTWGTWGAVGLGPILQVEGSRTSLISLTADANPGATTLTMTDTSLISAGQVILLGSTDAYAVEQPTAYKGEQLRVKSVDSGTQVTIHGYVRDTYLTSDGAGVYAYGTIKDFHLEALGFENAEPDSHASLLVGLAYVERFTITDVGTYGSDQAGISLFRCMEGQVHGVLCRDHTDNQGSGRYGYGVQAVGATENVVIGDSTFIGCRHGVATGGVNGQFGAGRNILVDNCTSMRSKDVAFDTHAGATDITFNNCRAQHSPKLGFTVRSRNTKIVGCSVEWCGGGAVIYPDGHGCDINGLTVRNVQGATYEGIRVSATTSDGFTASPENVVIRGSRFEGMPSNGIAVLGGIVDLEVRDNVFRNVGTTANTAIKFGGTVAGSVIRARLFGNTFTKQSSTVEPGLTGGAGYPFQIVTSGALSSCYARDNYFHGSGLTAWTVGSGSADLAVNNNTQVT